MALEPDLQRATRTLSVLFAGRMLTKADMTTYVAANLLMEELRRQTVHLSLNAERLHIDAPAGTLTPELREYLLAHKPRIMEILAQEQRLEARILATVMVLHHPTAREVGRRLHLPSDVVRVTLERLIVQGTLEKYPIKQSSYRYTLPRARNV